MQPLKETMAFSRKRQISFVEDRSDEDENLPRLARIARFSAPWTSAYNEDETDAENLPRSASWNEDESDGSVSWNEDESDEEGTENLPRSASWNEDESDEEGAENLPRSAPLIRRARFFDEDSNNNQDSLPSTIIREDSSDEDCAIAFDFPEILKLADSLKMSETFFRFEDNQLIISSAGIWKPVCIVQPMPRQ